MYVIETDKLTKYYGKERGIIDVSLKVEEGEIFGFIGPNGAGKSTTIRTLLSLIHPSSGSAKIFGRDCFKEGHDIRKDIGYLPSEVFYYNNMKVIDLLKYSASFYNKDCTERIHELAEVMDLDVNRKIDDLSFGNKKKVGIVQGLLHQPKLIILDEPTGGLDPLMQQKFFDLIREENKRGATVFFSSHILDEVQKMCDRVAIIKDGKIIKTESIESLRNDNYKKIKVVSNKSLDSSIFNMDGVTDLKSNKVEANFMYRGNMNKVIEKLSTVDVKNLLVQEPTLEEIFMYYYKKED
ncbi:ABC transporter ATP-binding protein [Oceanirhabdus seepicola]|uniref:ABC transporter ATP-binding protein n=1 Tax=Oceanirhabdus seepicola TaxID=2828781 RepID=A0A9J6NZA6_9CLOT|nr:ABC transporter ATP-binding protein [Oceanirhabdus seepicola]MCM1989863.1 ABC transporter ATP-binding protein [Oceanirhabdus seepicola]